MTLCIFLKLSANYTDHIMKKLTPIDQITFTLNLQNVLFNTDSIKYLRRLVPPRHPMILAHRLLNFIKRCLFLGPCNISKCSIFSIFCNKVLLIRKYKKYQPYKLSSLHRKERSEVRAL